MATLFVGRFGKMRVMMFLLVALASAAAQAQTNVYSAQRGHWSIWNSTSVCRAVNRPPTEFNYAPYNALEIAVRRNAIAVEVFFWPRSIDPSRDYRLILDFGVGDVLALDAKSTIGDFMLASAEENKLWRLFQDGKLLRVAVEGEQTLALAFALDDIGWVLDSLTSCRDLLPKE
jgi:hypothetical protein